VELCNRQDDSCAGALSADESDVDGDGFTPCEGDCEDANPLVGPGAQELCNGVDDVCAGSLDASEQDGDSDGLSPCEGDCDDASETTLPEATELCNGIDDDCLDGIPADEIDSDLDGFSACEGDCDEGAATTFPEATELCNGIDDDCLNGVPTDEADGDTDTVSICEGDCDDSADTVLPTATELCNSIDDDCDGDIDDDDDDIPDAGDGVAACTDCDDSDPATHPGAEELCNGLDDSCAGSLSANETDVDGDGSTPCEGDCDDTTTTTAPGEDEICADGIDNDCDNLVDEPLPITETPKLGTGRANGSLDLWPINVLGGIGSPVESGDPLDTGISLAVVVADLDGDGVAEGVRQQLDPLDEDNDVAYRSQRDCAGTVVDTEIAGIELPGDHRLLAAADLDNDGDIDLLSVGFSGAQLGLVRAHLNDGLGAYTGVSDVAFLHHANGSGRWSLGRSPADHDGDGFPDLVECGWTPPVESSTCLLHPGRGDGGFNTPTIVVTMAEPIDAVVQGDFNDDDDVDLLVGLSDHGDPGATYFLAGSGSGAFGLPTESVDVNPAAESAEAPGGGRGVAIPIDFDQDGTLDLALQWDTGVSSSDRALASAEGVGTGTFSLSLPASFTTANPEPSGTQWLAVPRP